jgi:hypothetical protein
MDRHNGVAVVMLPIEHTFQLGQRQGFLHGYDFLGYLLLQFGILVLHDHFEEHFGIFQLLPPFIPFSDNFLKLTVFFLDYCRRFGIIPESRRKRLSFQFIQPIFLCG